MNAPGRVGTPLEASPSTRAAGERNGNGVWGGEPPRRRGWARRRRSWALAAVGVLITAGSATAGLVIWGGSGSTRELLVAARPIAAGHVIEPADLRPVSVGAAEGVSAIAVRDAAAVVGRPASVPVAAGALLPADVVRGAGVLPPAGRAVVSVAVPAGVVPPQAGPGAPVRVLPAPSGVAPSGQVVAARGWDAVLLGVAAARSGDTVVVSLQVAEGDAAGVVSAGSKIAVVVLSGPPTPR